MTKVPVPPFAVTDTDPSDPPLQVTSFINEQEIESKLGSDIVSEHVAIHPLASVTV